MTQEGGTPAVGLVSFVRHHPEEHLRPLELIIAGALAGVTAKTVTAPLDRIRLLYQVSPSNVYSFRNAVAKASQIAEMAGPQSLWRGHVATVLRVMPFAGVQFWVYDMGQCTQGVGESSPWRTVASAFSGASACAAATVVTYPLDLLRVRMAVDLTVQPRLKNYPVAIEEITRTEGFRGLFRGISPTLLGIIPYGALSFSTFEFLKQHLRSRQADVPLWQMWAVGSVSGVIAQLCAYPLHVARRRMQVAQSPDLGAQGSLAYSTTRRAISGIHATEGMSGLFKGASLTWVKGPVTVGLAFATNDALKDMMQRHQAREQYVPLLRVDRGDGTQRLNAVESLACGGIAGATAKSIVAPGDRVKIIYQTDASKAFRWRGAWEMSCGILREQGLRGLWRGHGATLARVVPYSATAHASFDPYKRLLRQTVPELGDVPVRFVAGAAAGTSATTLTYPLDMLRARMAAHQSREAMYDGYGRAIAQIIRTEGVLSLWSGLRPTLLGIVPYSGIAFSLFGTFKASLKEYKSDSAGNLLMAGAVAGLIAQSATYPLDVVRRRMQVFPGRYSGVVHALLSIHRHEGVKGLVKGLSMNWVKGPIASSVSFFTNDSLRSTAASRH